MKEVLKGLEAVLERQASDLDKGKNGINIHNTKIDEYVRALLENLNKTDDIEKEVSKRLTKQLRDNVETKNLLFRFYTDLKPQIIKAAQGASPNVFPPAEKKKKSPPVPRIDFVRFGNHYLAQDLEKMCATRGLAGIDSLFRYVPAWVRDRENPGGLFYDHGLASGLLYAQVTQFWKAALQDSSRPVVRILQLRGGREVSLPGGTVTATYSAVPEVLYTILVHNLYPSSFENVQLQAFRTKRDKKVAFTYMALLCDSLQPWDRKRLFNQGTGPLPYTTYAENFNIEAEGNVLKITERGDHLRIDERQAALRTFLDSFLDKASEMVKLHLSEWR